MGETSAGSVRRLSVVVSPPKSYTRGTVRDPKTNNPHHNRCVGSGLGSPIGEVVSTGEMVAPTPETTHKPKRTLSSPANSPTLGSEPERSHHPVLAGQPHCRRLFVKPRGNTFTLHDESSKAIVSTGRFVTNLCSGELHSGLTKCGSGHELASGTGVEDRMDVQSRHVQMDQPKQSIRPARTRLICEPIHDTTSRLRVTMPGSAGVPGGRTDCRLARQHEFVRLPSDLHYGQSGGQNSTGKAQKATINSTNAHESNVVPICQSVEPLQDGDTSGSAAAGAAALPTPSPKPRHVIFDNVSHQLPKLDEQGYHPDVISHLKKARAITTNHSYDSKWKLFVGFAATNKFEPTLASPAQLAKFLTHLFDNRKVKPSTIKGYRAAIGHILRLATGYDPGEDPIIKTLIQSFERQKPTTRNTTPTWDVALVLESWAKTDGDTMPLKLLQTKTIFLLALASGARRSEIWALNYKVKAKQTEPQQILIPFDEQYTFKTQFTRKTKSKRGAFMVVQPLPDGHSKNICPMITTIQWVKRTRTVRKANQTALFFPIDSNTPVTTKQMISGQVVKAINWAYQQTNTPKPKQVKAHDVRGIAATLRVTAGSSIDDVLEAGDWTTPITYFKHYNQQLKRETISVLKRRSHLACAGTIIETERL